MHFKTSCFVKAACIANQINWYNLVCHNFKGIWFVTLRKGKMRYRFWVSVGSCGFGIWNFWRVSSSGSAFLQNFYLIILLINQLFGYTFGKIQLSSAKIENNFLLRFKPFLGGGGKELLSHDVLCTYIYTNIWLSNSLRLKGAIKKKVSYMILSI